MTLLANLTWGQILADGIGDWIVHGLSVVCLLQYVMYSLRIANITRDLSISQRHLSEIEEELQSARRDRSLARQECNILRGFVGSTEPKRAVQGLLKSLVPNSEKGFSGYIEVLSEEHQLAAKFGWELEDEIQPRIPEELLRKLAIGEYIYLSERELPRSGLLNWFKPAHKRLLSEIFLFPVRSNSELIAVLVTTQLMSSGASQDEQIAMMNRLLDVVAATADRLRKLEDHREQLRWTSDMLELHALADVKYSGPVQMVQVFLENLARMTGSDRGAIYFVGQGGSRVDHDTRTPWIIVGESLQIGVRNVRTQVETWIINEFQNSRSLVVMDRSRLKGVPAGALVGGVLAIPLVHNSTVIGMICLSRSADDDYTAANQQLTEWAGEFLSTRIVRTVAQANVEKEARQDGLTGLANRRTFDQAIARELNIASQNGSECSLILLDLDRFKSVNDTYGHPAGDQVLRKTAQILKEQTEKIRNSDRILCTRYGGEEMAVLLPGVGLAGALRIAESIRKAIQGQTIRLEGIELRVTTSSGVACYPQHGSGVEELIAAADSGLYAAKENGRNRVEIPQSTSSAVAS